MSDREVCRRGLALAECLEVHVLTFLNSKFGGDYPASYTHLSSGSGSTIDLAACAFTSISVDKDYTLFLLHLA